MLQFLPDGTLPPGIQTATWPQVEELLAFNDRRQELFAGLKRACLSLQQAGCNRIYIGGSFATDKEFPRDFDICWADDNVDFVKLQALDPSYWTLKTIVPPKKPNTAANYFRPARSPVSMIKPFWNSFSKTETVPPKELSRSTSHQKFERVGLYLFI